jgi:hypothetical protein
MIDLILLRAGENNQGPATWFSSQAHFAMFNGIIRHITKPPFGECIGWPMPLQVYAVAGGSNNGLSTARSIFPVQSFAEDAPSNRGNQHDPAVDPD